MKNIGGEAQVSFEQEADCCSENGQQHLHVRFKDGGGGSYIVLETEEWAIDSPEEFIKQLTKAHEDFKKLAGEE
jgi:hypothetical protein